jgi:hypothetical protein
MITARFAAEENVAGTQQYLNGLIDRSRRGQEAATTEPSNFDQCQKTTSLDTGPVWTLTDHLVGGLAAQPPVSN